MQRFPYARIIIALSMACLFLCLSFVFFAPKASASCRYGQTTACVHVSPTTVSYLPGGGHCVSFDVTGAHWPANDTVKLVLDPSLSTAKVLGFVGVNQTGNFTFHVSSVCGVSKGSHTVKAVDQAVSLIDKTTFNVV